MAKSGVHKVPVVVPDLRGKSIISLDLGRRTGWCVFAPKSDIERYRDSGIFELYPDRAPADVDDAERFAALGRFLTALDDAIGGADVVVFEQVDGGTKGRQTVLYNGYRAIVLEWSRRLGKHIVPLSVSKIKAVVGGRGGASKEEVEAAVVKLGYLPFDDNEADAIAALHTAIRLSKSGDLEAAVRDSEALNLTQFKTERKVKKRLTVVDKSSTVFDELHREVGDREDKRQADTPGARNSKQRGRRSPAKRQRRKAGVRNRVPA